MRILNVAGARPNFVKIAPLVREMRRHPAIVPLLVHTGQHYDEVMSGQLFRDLEIPAPDFNLEVGSASHAAQTAEVMRRLEPVLLSTRPDLVLVVGDVNSTLAATLTAVKLGIPVAHVEAGLRSFDRTMPEEINRVLTDAIADLLFVTEESGREHLLREGISADKIHFVGNVMIDALMTFRPHWQNSAVFDRLDLHENQPYAVLTLHRPSNVDDPTNLTKLLDALQDVARHIPIVFPVHPRVRARLGMQEEARVPTRDADALSAGKGIAYLDPLGYLDFIALMSRARLVLTDSGGIQEETTILGVPCLTLRDNTERPATVTWGTNRVIGTDPRRIVEEALRALNHSPRTNGPPPLWDGQAASRIVKVLVERGPRGLIS
ncbi:MAG: UDP-N-acetylglucosamine 2-epimerase (non-hydrolyzing) [Candidatus Rokuibacteriota bacterium]|nr:MAG: UDP-N-acetylglucosamine 2-epimerase (non-hydrolyzing) [Candidatus Rokubacteria bacterium]